jgi:hypothetical protein
LTTEFGDDGNGLWEDGERKRKRDEGRPEVKEKDPGAASLSLGYGRYRCLAGYVVQGTDWQ